MHIRSVACRSRAVESHAPLARVIYVAMMAFIKGAAAFDLSLEQTQQAFVEAVGACPGGRRRSRRRARFALLRRSSVRFVCARAWPLCEMREIACNQHF